MRPQRTAALVTMHAKMGTRPDWYEEPPRACMIEPDRGPKNRGKVVGECRGKDLYTIGSYCPLRWEPSPIEIAIARAEYAAWHRGLALLADELVLAHIVLPPAAPAQPWREREPVMRIFVVGERGAMPKLPLRPQREIAAAPPKRQSGASKVRTMPIG